MHNSIFHDEVLDANAKWNTENNTKLLYTQKKILSLLLKASGVVFELHYFVLIIPFVI